MDQGEDLMIRRWSTACTTILTHLQCRLLACPRHRQRPSPAPQQMTLLPCLGRFALLWLHSHTYLRNIKILYVATFQWKDKCAPITAKIPNTGSVCPTLQLALTTTYAAFM